MEHNELQSLEDFRLSTSLVSYNEKRYQSLSRNNDSCLAYKILYYAMDFASRTTFAYLES